MSKDITLEQWKKIKGKVRKQCPKLTDADLDKINGNYDLLVCMIEERYDATEDDARKMIAAIPDTPWMI